MEGMVLSYPVDTNNQNKIQCIVSVIKNGRNCVISSSWHQQPGKHNALILEQRNKRILKVYLQSYQTSIFWGSTTAYTLSDRSPKVSPSMVCVHPLLRLFLTFFKVNLTITLGWISLIAINPKLSKKNLWDLNYQQYTILSHYICLYTPR